MERDKLKKEVPKKIAGIFYLEANRGFFYDQTLSSPIGLEFTQDIVSDLEVVSRKKLEVAIQTFLNANKIAPKSIIILLSPNVTFDKDFPLGTVQMEKNIQEFLDLVPFQDYISRQAKFPGKIKVVAANRSFSDTVKESFSNSGFLVSAVIPLSFCLETIPQLKTNLDLALVLDKAAELRGFSLTSEVIISEESQKKEKKDNKRLYGMLGVLAILFLILFFVIYKFVLTPAKPPVVVPTTTNTAPVPTVFEPSNITPTIINSQINPSTESANIQN